jgi:cytidine deaminase
MNPHSEKDLLTAALKVREQAYAPYSNFAVGAAVLDEAGRVHSGCNVENAAYPQGQCAEANAIGAMRAGGGRRIVAIAIAGPEGRSCPPCGGCLQRIREFAEPGTPILLGDATGLIVRYRLTDLLPHSFGPDVLGNL